MSFREARVDPQLMGELLCFRDDLDDDEYKSMKDDTVEQLKEFSMTLGRMNKGDVTLNNTLTSMRAVCIPNA